jgi:uncharacterized LabA/DUF88 family protein
MLKKNVFLFVDIQIDYLSMITRTENKKFLNILLSVSKLINKKPKKCIERGSGCFIL